MTAARYLEGILLIAITVVPIGAAAHVWRERLLPGWGFAEAFLAEIVISVATILLVSEVLGAAHLFRLGAIVAALILVGAAGWHFGARRSGRLVGTNGNESIDEALSPPNPPGATIVAVVAIGVVAADWGTRTADAFHHGMTTVDTLWYHMPFAARFVQQGTITPLHYVDSGSVTAFFPANSELVHALGILFMGNDSLSPLINLGWAAIALLAGWCIGRPFGVAPVTLTGVAMLIATPGLVATQPGGAYDDIVGFALLLSCAALLITAFRIGGSTRLAGQGVAALAAGLALGTKFTFIAPVGALTVGIWVLARRRCRLREGAVWLVLVTISGGFWYFRNLVAVGNPIPSLHIKLGPLALPSPPIGEPSSSVSHFLLNVQAWQKYFLPGLRLSFGPAWWVLFAFAAAGLVLGATSGPIRTVRMLAWVGMAAGVAFLITPEYFVPVSFVDNVRYGDPALLLGIVLLPLVPGLRVQWRFWSILGGYLAVLAVTQLDGTIWPIHVFTQTFASPIGGIDSLAGLLFGLLLLVFGLLFYLTRQRLPWRISAPTVVILTVALVASGFGLQQFYLRNRYTNSNPTPIFYLAQHILNARIAVAGEYTQIQYELYGHNLSNFVQYIGQTGPNGGYAPIGSCEQWRRLLNKGHYDYVVTSTGLVSHRKDAVRPSSSYTAWTSTDSASTLIRRDITVFRGTSGSVGYVGISLFRLRGPLDPAACARSGLTTATPRET